MGRRWKHKPEPNIGKRVKRKRCKNNTDRIIYRQMEYKDKPFYFYCINQIYSQVELCFKFFWIINTSVFTNTKLKKTPKWVKTEVSDNIVGNHCSICPGHDILAQVHINSHLRYFSLLLWNCCFSLFLEVIRVTYPHWI